MAITKIEFPTVGVPTIGSDDYTKQNSQIANLINLNNSRVLTNYDNVTIPTIAQSSIIKFAGLLYIVDTSDYVILGTAPADTETGYIKLSVVDATEIKAEWILTNIGYDWKPAYCGLYHSDESMILSERVLNDSGDYLKEASLNSFGFGATLNNDGVLKIESKIITPSNVNLGLNTSIINSGTGGTGSCVVIGENASVSGNSILDLNSIAIGADSTASGYNSVALGDNSVALGDNSVALGDNSVASGYSSVASGYNSVASGYYSVAIGSGINVTDYSVGIGFNADSNSNCGDYQININNRILYFEFPSTASQNTVYDALAPYISSGQFIGAMGRVGNENITFLAQTSSTRITARNYGSAIIANFTNGSSTVLGSDLQVAFVPYANVY